jgi:histone H3/H4
MGEAPDSRSAANDDRSACVLGAGLGRCAAAARGEAGVDARCRARRAAAEFKTHNDLPLARIKRIMKADEDVRMIAAEAPVLFAKACEMFVVEVTMRCVQRVRARARKGESGEGGSRGLCACGWQRRAMAIEERARRERGTRRSRPVASVLRSQRVGLRLSGGLEAEDADQGGRAARGGDARAVGLLGRDRRPSGRRAEPTLDCRHLTSERGRLGRV